MLPRRMRDFLERRADVLVTTTIIESGLDLPSVNTLFVEEADHFGLADLHPLRGRVGRYKHQAYACFLLPPDRPVTPTTLPARAAAPGGSGFVRAHGQAILGRDLPARPPFPLPRGFV